MEKIMDCDNCGSDRILEINGKVSDCGTYEFDGVEVDGYAPDVTNVCGGDYIYPDICLNCGKVQGKFPVENPDMGNDDEDDDFTGWSV